MNLEEIKQRLEAIREAGRKENISYSELAELQELAEYIEPGDVELLELAGVRNQRADYRAYAQGNRAMQEIKGGDEPRSNQLRIR
jgi:DNA-binding SARP family transcriptional activator